MKKNKAEKLEKLASISKKEGGDAKWKEVAKWNRKHADALEDFVIIAGHIRKVLKDKGWTQAELAEKLEVTPQALTRIMKGRQNLTLQSIRKIENELDVRLITVHQNKAMVTEKIRMVQVPIKYDQNISKEYKLEGEYQGKDQEIETARTPIEPYNLAS